MKGQLAEAGGVTKGRNGRTPTPLSSAIMAVDISLSPPILTSAFQQACRTAASNTSETMTSGEVMKKGAVGLGGVGPSRQALGNQVVGAHGKGEQHAVQTPGVGSMDHHVTA